MPISPPSRPNRAPLRPALEALRDGRSLAPLVNALRPILGRLLGEYATPDLEEELLSDFVMGVSTAAGERQMERMLALPDDQLKSAVRRRLLQLWTERIPHWNLLRTLRSHVRTALAQPSGASTPVPARLQDDAGDWQAEAVAAAAHALVRQQPALAGEPNKVADLLFRQHGPGRHASLDDEGVSEVAGDVLAPDDFYQRYVEAPRHVRVLRAEMGEELFGVFSLRMKGLGLLQISQLFGHRHAAWAYGRYERAGEIFRRYLFSQGISYRSGLAVGRKAARAFRPELETP